MCGACRCCWQRGCWAWRWAFFSVRACHMQVRPQYRRTRAAILVGGMIYLSSAAALHFLIGSLADWTSRLAPLLGRAEALAMVQAWYERLAPALLLPYAGMLLLILGSAFAVLTRKTILPRWMLGFHLITWQLILMLIPDIRQMLGTEISTWDFVLSQCSGNAALLIWMLANAIWAGRQE